MMVCPFCGSDIERDAPKCGHCGTPLTVAQSLVDPKDKHDDEVAASAEAPEDLAHDQPVEKHPADDDTTAIVPEIVGDGDGIVDGDNATVGEPGSGSPTHDESAADTAIDPTRSDSDDSSPLRSGEFLRARRYMILRLLDAGNEQNEYVAVDRERRTCPECGVTDLSADASSCSACEVDLADTRIDHPEVRLLEALSPETLAWAAVVSKAPLEHPRLMRVRDSFEYTPYGDAVRHYVVTDVPAGRPLTAITPPLGPRKVVIWGAQLADALAAMHEAGVVHGSVRGRSVRVDGDDVMLDGFERVRPLPSEAANDDGATLASGDVSLEGDSDGPTPGSQESVMSTVSSSTAGPNPDVASSRVESIRGDIVALGALLQSLLPRRSVPAEVTELIARAIGVVPGHTFEDSRSFAAALHERADLMAADAPDVVLLSGYASDVGRVRELNEDSLVALEFCLFQISKPATVGLYAIADGMGGHASGEVASGIAVRELVSAFVPHLTLPPAGETFLDAAACESTLLQACSEAGRAVYESRMTSGSDMGATLVSAVVQGGEVFVAHAGDSRAYRVNETGIERLTNDHTLVQQWVDQGQMSLEEARTHPRRNLIYRQVGEGPDVSFDVNRASLTDGDWLLLCSDGLSGMLHDSDILSVVESGVSPQAVCDELVLRANQAGGDDNISVVAATVRRVDRS